MNIGTILKTLGVSKLRAAFTLLFGGMSGFLALIAEKFTDLLRKADAEKLKYYAEFSAKLAKFISYGVELFVTNECYKKAGTATVGCLKSFAEHVSDSEYTKEEITEDIDCIEASISLWKEAPQCAKELA